LIFVYFVIFIFLLLHSLILNTFRTKFFLFFKVFLIHSNFIQQLVMANMIFPYQLILHDLHRYESMQHWPFVTSVNMVTYFIHCVFVMKKEPFTLDFGKSHLFQRVDTYLS
ncbi:hypothetical protein T02_4583, partial [Trichinella nativa]